MSEPKYVRFTVGDEWAALYVDGKLDTVSDAYLVDERIAELLGVVYQESDVMDRVQTRDEAPPTLVELREREKDLVAVRGIAESLREQARGLLQRAQDLEGV